MLKPNEIPIKQLRELIRLEPETGLIFWQMRVVESFLCVDGGYAKRACSRWNSYVAGTEALAAINGGYKRGTLLGKPFHAHRVVWALFYGEWCSTNIDHINGDKSDNRPSNLRAATHEANSRNQKLRSSNTSGVMGVSWNEANKAWIVRINAEGERKYLGKFQDFDAAVDARKRAEIQYGYDPTHGRLAA
jgi:hypothetical protein